MAINGNIFSISDVNIETVSELHQQLGGLLGVGRREDGMFHQADFFNASSINPFAKYKSQNNDAWIFPWGSGDLVRRQAHWGLNGLDICTKSSLFNATGIERATVNPPYRLRDFDNYFHAVPKNVIHQAVGNKMLVSKVYEDSDSTIPFYIFQKSGWIEQRKVGDNKTGIDYNNKIGLSAEQLDLSIGSEDLAWGYYRGLYEDIPFYLGIVLYKENGSVATDNYGNQSIYTCSSPLKVQTDKHDTNMYIMQPDLLALPTGKYVAVAAAINQGYDYYLPLQNAVNYPNKFEIEIAGPKDFRAENISMNGEASTIYQITTRQNYVDIEVAVRNNSDKNLIYQSDKYKRWNLKTTIRGTIQRTDGSLTINTTRKSIPLTGFDIYAGSSYFMYFRVEKIWQNNESDAYDADYIRNGSVNLEFTLQFDDDAATNSAEMTRLREVVFQSY